MPAGRIDVADEERGVGVAVYPADEGGDVEVDDVAVLQRSRVGDAVADDLVDAGAHALREVVVVERARVGVAFDAQVVDVHVDRIGRDPGGDHLAGQAQHLGGDDAGVAHAFDDVGGLDP